jgi:predicted dithiol-disulfide oxidoreductase (DUF899 family)
MNLPKIVSHDEWLVARKRLLAKDWETIVHAIHEHAGEAR